MDPIQDTTYEILNLPVVKLLRSRALVDIAHHGWCWLGCGLRSPTLFTLPGEQSEALQHSKCHAEPHVPHVQQLGRASAPATVALCASLGNLWTRVPGMT